jgi:hypothetical protein
LYLFLTLFISLEKGKLRGRIKIISEKEALADVEEDPLAYIAPEIRVDPPLLATVYTISVMDLRKVHPFSKNSPLLKATCGKWKDSTFAIENQGSDAKWTKIMWSVPIGVVSKFKIQVLSGSIVIGYVIFRAEDFSTQPVDKYGLTEVEGMLIDGKSFDPTGNIIISMYLIFYVSNYFSICQYIR